MFFLFISYFSFPILALPAWFCVFLPVCQILPFCVQSCITLSLYAFVYPSFCFFICFLEFVYVPVPVCSYVCVFALSLIFVFVSCFSSSPQIFPLFSAFFFTQVMLVFVRTSINSVCPCPRFCLFSQFSNYIYYFSLLIFLSQ